MADSGPGISGPMSTGPSPGSDQGDAVKGMMQLNNLVYTLNPDLSVVVNRTHKTQFPQTQDYTSKQTTIFIVNSGSDFVDPARSFLSLDVVLPEFSMTNTYAAGSAERKTIEVLDYREIYQNHYFGPNGSILNLIDSVVVSSRSGDELSRVSDYGQLMNMQLPLIFGQDWMESIGSNLGMGSYLGAPNPLARFPNEQQTQRFCIPLYLLSPYFNYGRLMPSAVMSGLRIEIRWKPLDQACQMFYTGAPKYLPAVADLASVYPVNEPQTEFATFFSGNSITGGSVYPLAFTDGTIVIPSDAKWTYTAATDEDGFGNGTGQLGVSTAGGAGIPLGTMTYTAAMVGADSPLVGTRMIRQGMTIVIPLDASINKYFTLGDDPLADPQKLLVGGVLRFTVMDITGPTLNVVSNSSVDVTAAACDGVLGQGGIVPGAFICSQKGPAVYESKPGARIFSGLMRLPSEPVVDYTIKRPQLSLCSVQLTDAIQRVLNEVSSVNGLEIVYSDWDRTSQPFVTATGDSNPVYMEIRKSASRALAVCARVVESSPSPHLYDSFASCRYASWNDYQFQLGSLYFPQQRVEDSNANADIRKDNVAVLAYNLFLDSGDRYHPKAPPSACTLRGPSERVSLINYHPVGQNGEHGPSEYLAPRSTFGKWGSYVNGGTTVATTLERSEAFDLSGVPINNARTLAVRGNVAFSLPNDTQLRANFRATLVAYLKYVRCARAFLLNIEVEQ